MPNNVSFEEDNLINNNFGINQPNHKDKGLIALLIQTNVVSNEKQAKVVLLVLFVFSTIIMIFILIKNYSQDNNVMKYNNMSELEKQKIPEEIRTQLENLNK
jgi:hypothetical protein